MGTHQREVGICWLVTQCTEMEILDQAMKGTDYPPTLYFKESH